MKLWRQADSNTTENAPCNRITGWDEINAVHHITDWDVNWNVHVQEDMPCADYSSQYWDNMAP